MAFEQIACSLEHHVLTITLNRPEKMNAFTGVMLRELIEALDLADQDDAVRAIVFTGAGRAFCAGADLSAGAETFDYDTRSGGASQTVDYSDPRLRDGGGLLTLRLFECLKPVIAAVNGPAVGVGATMQLAMDVRLASENAKFGFVFARRGIVPEACSSWFLPRAVGISKALEWTYSGRVFPASEALEAGLVRSLHAPEDLLGAAHEIAREIAENTSAVSVALTRQMMWRMLGADHPMEAHKVDSRGIFTTGRGADAHEGVMSFLEKRPAQYSLKVSEDMPDFFPWWTERPYE
ncbi:MAG: crotonase/enoyl-CoA hydratase family protein [Alphaproteobacteria bacterium]